jgi:trimethylamine---corrinoid protein Co-methyltransferase
MPPKDMREYLPAECVEQIHQTTVRFLENVGVDFPSAVAVDVFKRRGVKTDGSRVYLSEAQLFKALETAPCQFTVQARNAARSVTVGAGTPVFAPGYGSPFLVDPVDGTRAGGVRAPTMADYHQLVKLAHALPNQDMSGYLLVEPGDVSGECAPVHMLHAHMLHSDKPFMGSTAGERGASHTMEMARILFGGELADQYVCVGLINSLTPLRYSSEMLEALVAFAEARQPVVIAALAMAGSTAPVTLAGVLALQNAELLAGAALAQMISPGTPVIIGSTSTNIDMKTGGLAIGSPELSQMIAAHAQLARFYNLPSRSGGALTDASYPDNQAGFESMMALLTTVNCGIDFILHAGGILSSYLAFSFEKFVLDDEMCGMVKRFHEGIRVEPDTLAYDVAANVGVGGNFLADDHTVQRCRTEFWRPALCDRAGLDAWTQGGRLTAVDRARQRWQKLVAKHVDPPLDAITARQLQQYVEQNA